ncbi:SphA family protein [Flavobacterium sp. P21]|uniref:SphA family protein n=1 Tax=Flavobacterium sp. P21 TaxID=3423948 RepID=UPI003D670B40
MKTVFILQEYNKEKKAGKLWSSLLFLLLILSGKFVYAQDPVLPPTNLGLANMYDGIAGKPGFVYVNYTQAYENHQVNNSNGKNTGSDLKINSLLSMHQFIYLTPIELFGGNLGVTVLIPVVKITATSQNGDAPAFNPSMLGDVVQGTAIQWSDKKLFGKQFSHRIELDVSFPIGSYSKNYAINPSAHLYTIGFYHAFTLTINEKLSVSTRNQFNYNTHIIGKEDKPGAFYNGNYSVEFALLKNLHVEVAAYYLAQLNQDSYDGDNKYYINQYGIENTKQSVFGLGPGLVYLGHSGLLIEGKVFFETIAKNTTQG